MNTISNLEQWLNKGIPTAARKLTEKHELCIKILDAIYGLERRRRNHLDSAEGNMGNLYPKLKVKYIHKADISLMALERMWRRYFKVCKDIME